MAQVMVRFLNATRYKGAMKEEIARILEARGEVIILTERPPAPPRKPEPKKEARNV